MLVIKKISFVILILSVTFFKLNAKDLNNLFEDLQKAENIYAAEYVEKNIWRNWVTHPKSKYLTDKLENGTFSMNNNQYRLALKLFSDVINEDPNWAEAWNKRATVLYMIGDYQESQNDIDKVLSLEQRHFGALAGQGLVNIKLKNYEKAIESYKKAEEIYPAMQSPKIMIKQIQELIKQELI